MAPVKKLLNMVGSCEIRGRLRCNAASIGYRNRIRKGLIHSRVTRVSWNRCQGINLRMGPSRTSVPTMANSGRNGNQSTGDPRRGAVIGFAVADSQARATRQTPCPGRAPGSARCAARGARPGTQEFRKDSRGKILATWLWVPARARARRRRHLATARRSLGRDTPAARAPECRRTSNKDNPLAATSTPDRPAGSR
jgi:hypothetical protein